jgi:hypothetical protein
LNEGSAPQTVPRSHHFEFFRGGLPLGRNFSADEGRTGFQLNATIFGKSLNARNVLGAQSFWTVKPLLA